MARANFVITLEIFFLDRPMNGAAALALNLPED
jgi:hypothetical protein